MAGAAVEPGKARARTLIRARGVAKSYQTGDGEVESLRPLEFEIGEGEFVSVVGPSGCGKSTLLKLIAGLLPASRGSIEIGGAVVDGPPPGIGIVFQSHVLLPWRTVLDNILLQTRCAACPASRASPAPASWSRWSASKASRTSFRGSCPAACSSAPRSAARWCTIRRSC